MSPQFLISLLVVWLQQQRGSLMALGSLMINWKGLVRMATTLKKMWKESFWVCCRLRVWPGRNWSNGWNLCGSLLTCLNLSLEMLRMMSSSGSLITSRWSMMSPASLSKVKLQQMMWGRTFKSWKGCVTQGCCKFCRRHQKLWEVSWDHNCCSEDKDSEFRQESQKLLSSWKESEARNSFSSILPSWRQQQAASDSWTVSVEYIKSATEALENTWDGGRNKWHFISLANNSDQEASVASHCSSHDKHTPWFVLPFYFWIMHFLDFWLIYAHLSQNIVVAICALFSEDFLDWKVESADFFTFRMYGLKPLGT